MLLFSARAEAAVATCNVANNGNSNGGTTSSVSGTFDAQNGCGASNYALLVLIEGDTGNDDVTGCTYNGTGMTLLGHAYAGGGGRHLQLHGLLGPASGSNTVSCSASASHYLFYTAASYSGVMAFGTSTTTSVNANAQLTGTITVSTANSWVVAGCAGSDVSTWTGVTNAVVRTQYVPFSSPVIFDNNTAASVGSYSMTVNSGNAGDIGMIMVELKATSGGGGGGGTYRGLLTTGVGVH